VKAKTEKLSKLKSWTIINHTTHEERKGFGDNLHTKANLPA